MATRRIAAVTALMLGLLIALTPAQSQAATLLARAGTISVSSLTPTSAAFGAGFTPGDSTSGFRFQVLSGSTPVQASPLVDLAAGGPTAAISYTATGLVPNESYQVQLVWFNAGTGVAVPVTGALTSFVTPMQAAAVPSLATSAAQIQLGQSVTLTGSATANPLGSLGDLQASAGSGGAFSQYVSADGGPVFGTIGAGVGATNTFSESPLRNVRFRLALPGIALGADGRQVQQASVSRPVSVDVFPVASVVTSRPRNTAMVRAQANFGVHALAADYSGEYVYFYDAPNARSTGRLIGRDRLIRSSPNIDGVTRLSAHVLFSEGTSAYVHACVRHAILPDMGTPFTDAACGRPTLRAASH